MLFGESLLNASRRFHSFFSDYRESALSKKQTDNSQWNSGC